MKSEVDKSGTFAYNASGDPVSYTPLKFNPRSVKYEFRYDQNRRLTDYIGYIPNNSAPAAFEFWTKYVYDNGNRVVRDTTFHFGAYGPTITSFSNYRIITSYEYDSHERISRTISRKWQNDVPTGSVADYKFVYNDKGNLVVQGASPDENVSVYRTHRIWMFLSRNYSVNNVRKAKGYNSKGLPTAFPQNPQGSATLPFLQFLDFSDCEIEYECK
ncbi:MAG TPA: hypothetical protein VGD17_10075 [Chitinophagaceae bacterium]